MAGTTRFKVRKKKLGSYPFVSTVLSISFALLVMGIFGTLVIYSKELERIVRANVRMQVYLKSNINEAQRIQIEKNLASQYFLPAGREKSIEFISKEEAAKQFISETGEDFTKFLGENPLHDAFLVAVDGPYQEKQEMEKIKAELQKLNGVFQVDYVENVVASINKNVARIGIVLIGLSALLLGLVVVLIHNTLRLALFSQRFLIRSMQLVGARKSFIQVPFLSRAALHGFISGMLASGMLVGLIMLANNRIEELRLIQNAERMAVLLGSMVLIGIFVAVLSTWRAVSRYLELSLDELY
jgi:cell division transport system permease protein